MWRCSKVFKKSKNIEVWYIYKMISSDLKYESRNMSLPYPTTPGKLWLDVTHGSGMWFNPSLSNHSKRGWERLGEIFQCLYFKSIVEWIKPHPAEEWVTNSYKILLHLNLWKGRNDMFLTSRHQSIRGYALFNRGPTQRWHRNEKKVSDWDTAVKCMRISCWSRCSADLTWTL